MEGFYLKFIEIKKNTEYMGELFSKCFSEYQEILKNKEFFQIQNGFIAAKFSRDGCNYDKRGIFIFLNYLVRTIQTLEDEGVPLGLIEDLVNFLIENLSKLYPPGQDLIGEDENLK